MWLPLMHLLLGTWSATQARALTGNQTGDPLVHRLALNPLSHTSEVLIAFNRKSPAEAAWWGRWGELSAQGQAKDRREVKVSSASRSRRGLGWL